MYYKKQNDLMLMNGDEFFCRIIDQRKDLSLIFSQDYCQRLSSMQTSGMLQATFEPMQNLSSDFVEWSCTEMITTSPRYMYHQYRQYKPRKRESHVSIWLCKLLMEIKGAVSFSKERDFFNELQSWVKTCAKNSFLEERLGNRLCSHTILRFCWSFLIF